MPVRENKKNLILEVSLRLFQERSYEGVSMLEICRECGITKPTFYRYISSKEQLLRYYFSGSVADVLNTMNKCDPENHWERLFIGLTYTMEQNAKLGWDLYSHYWILNMSESSDILPYESEVHNVTVREIRKAQETGQIRNQSDPEQLYVLCRNIELGFIMKWCMSRAVFDLMHHCREDIEAALQVDHEKIRQDLLD